MHHSISQYRNELGRFAKAPAKKGGKRAKLGASKIPNKAPKVTFGKNYHTAQIYSKGFEFAFASAKGKGYKQACTFVYCKDFLHDAVWAAVNKTKWSVYGFHYDSKKDVPLDMEHCVFLFRNTQIKLSIDAEPTDRAQSISIVVIEFFVEQGSRFFKRRRVAGTKPLINPE